MTSTASSFSTRILFFVVSYFVLWTSCTTSCWAFSPVHVPQSYSSKLLQQQPHHHRRPAPRLLPTIRPYDHHATTSTTALFGIPKMFRWLTDQYPNINRRISEGLSDDMVVDNFYLDMNGIIHPCTHGNAEGQIVVLDETAMFKKIFLYVDRLYKLVKPRKLLYLAVDGVAPRAKMNQQRSRRFRSAKEAETTMMELVARGDHANMPPPNSKRFDSNCITPGTDFMLKLSLALQKWVSYKMETDEFWKRCGADVVVSGPDVPGEGEHKVMDYIRLVQEQYKTKDTASRHYHPGATHVLYGLDADLIMLGLVTHEPRFLLLREKMSVVMAGRGRNKHRKKKDMMEYDANDFEVLELASLRQLLAIQFRRFADDNMLQVSYDLNRVIDDFVFMCMLVGNDFLPHCPHLEIDNGAISLMMSTYVDLLPEWGDYLTEKEKICPERFEQFLYHLSVYEEEHFKRRGYEENEPGWQLSSEHETLEDDFYGKWFGDGPTPRVARAANRKLSMAERKKEQAVDKDDTNNGSSSGDDSSTATTLEQHSNDDKAEKKFHRRHPSDASRSYRDFYYETKLNWSPADRNNTLLNRRAHVRDYLEGLHWVLNYYHNGCPSWDWYFPHLYSPLCTDMVNLHEFYHDDNENDAEEETQPKRGFRTFPFEEGEAIPSLAQLLSVLPPQSSELLPKPFAELMLHPSSPLLPFYPHEFTMDANGKRQPWEAVVEIPFIESKVLSETVQSIMDADAIKPLLTNAERRRNVRGTSHTFQAPERDDVKNGEDGFVNGEMMTPTSVMEASSTSPPLRKGSPKKRRSKKTTGATATTMPRRRNAPKGSSKKKT